MNDRHRQIARIKAKEQKKTEFEAFLEILVIDATSAAAAIVKGLAEGINEVVVNVRELINKMAGELNTNEGKEVNMIEGRDQEEESLSETLSELSSADQPAGRKASHD